jgi:SNF2 family DNA or RNA helicase
MAHHQTIVEACAAVAAKVGLRVGVVHGGIAGTQRGRAVRQFQSGELDILCGSLETLAEGLNLTQADELIFVEQSFKPSRNQQAMRRIHRLGQERPCTVLDYQTPDSIDLKKRELLATKVDQQIRTLTAAQVKSLL